MLSGVASSSPAMLGSATLVMVVSSTCMMVAAITAMAVIRRLPLISFAFLLAEVHGHGGRCAYPQRIFHPRRIELDAYRHALRDFHPVAGCVLRRQQRKGSARAAGKAFHCTVEVVAGIHVHVDVHQLPWPDAGKFRFLEVGIDVVTVL